MNNVVNQTSKTILFEKFNESSSVPSLKKILSKDDTVESKNEDIKYKLEVSSYEEFLQKFKPTLYESKVLVDGELSIEYNFDRQTPADVEIDITSQAFYDMVMKIYSSKGLSGQSNSSFDYKSIQKVLTPDYIVKKAKNVRKELDYNFNEYLKLEKSGASKAEMAPYIKRVKTLRKNIIDTYKNSVIALLPIALDDTQKKIERIDKLTKNNSSSDEVNSPKLIPCAIKFDNEGNIKLEEVSVENQNQVIGIEGSSNAPKLLTIIENDYEKNAPNEIKNDFTKKLIMDTFVSSSTSMVQYDKSELIKKRDSYANIYKKTQESFAKQVSNLVEKLLNVKIFFDHATLRGSLPEDAKLIVANNSIEDLLEDDVKDRFSEYIQHMGKEPNDNKIWFAIVPALANDDFIDTIREYSIDDDAYDDDDNGNDLDNCDLVSYTKFPEFMKILGDAQIMTFFNFKGNETTNFTNLSKEMVGKYKEAVSNISNTEYAKYSVFCYPNFTILPHKEQEITNSICTIETASIYADSSYVACGMTVVTQNKDYLKSIGCSIKSNYPCVRFDLENKSLKDKDNKGIRIFSKMNIETNLNWGEDLKYEINKDGGFGFCFCGDKLFINGSPVQNVYVYNSKTLYKKEDIYQPIYRTLVGQFLTIYFNAIQDVEEFKDSVDEWDDIRKFANSILYINKSKDPNDIETVEYDSSTTTIKVHFGNIEEKLEVSLQES